MGITTWPGYCLSERKILSPVAVQFQDILSGEFQDILTGGSEKGAVFCEENGMPWKNTPMNTLRKEFALKALATGANLTALCLEYGSLRSTGD